LANSSWKRKILIVSDIRNIIEQTCIYMLVMHISTRFSFAYSDNTKLLNH